MRIIRSGQRPPVPPKPPPPRVPAFDPARADEFVPPRAVFLYWHLVWLSEHDRPLPSLATLAASLRLRKPDLSQLIQRMEAAGAIRTHRAAVYRNLDGILWVEIVATGKRTRPQGTLFWPVAQPHRARDAALLKRPG